MLLFKSLCTGVIYTVVFITSLWTFTAYGYFIVLCELLLPCGSRNRLHCASTTVLYHHYTTFYHIHAKRQDIVCVQIKKENCATACLTKTMELHIDVDIIKSELKKQVHELNRRRVVMKSQQFSEAGNRLKVGTDQRNLRKIWTECK